MGSNTSEISNSKLSFVNSRLGLLMATCSEASELTKLAPPEILHEPLIMEIDSIWAATIKFGMQ